MGDHVQQTEQRDKGPSPLSLTCHDMQQRCSSCMLMSRVLLVQANVFITSSGTAVLADPSLSQDCNTGDKQLPQSGFKWVTCLFVLLLRVTAKRLPRHADSDSLLSV